MAEDIADDSGSIFFGSVYNGKYKGILSKMPVLSSSASASANNFTGLAIALHSMSATIFNTNMYSATYPVDSMPVYALLDSGISFVYLPKPMAADIIIN